MAWSDMCNHLEMQDISNIQVMGKHHLLWSCDAKAMSNPAIRSRWYRTCLRAGRSILRAMQPRFHPGQLRFQTTSDPGWKENSAALTSSAFCQATPLCLKNLLFEPFGCHFVGIRETLTIDKNTLSTATRRRSALPAKFSNSREDML